MLAAPPIEVGALLTEGLIPRTGAKIFTLDIVARVALGVVVMNRLFYRVPRIRSHYCSPYMNSRA